MTASPEREVVQWVLPVDDARKVAALVQLGVLLTRTQPAMRDVLNAHLTETLTAFVLLGGGDTTTPPTSLTDIAALLDSQDHAHLGRVVTGFMRAVAGATPGAKVIGGDTPSRRF